MNEPTRTAPLPTSITTLTTVWASAIAVVLHTAGLDWTFSLIGALAFGVCRFFGFFAVRGMLQ
jgi:hypothetical protein